MNQQRHADEAEHAGDAADDDRHPLLEGVGDAEGIENPDRRQQPDEMTEKKDENADVKQVCPPGQLAPAQELARAAAPGVLLAVETNPAAQKKYDQAWPGVAGGRGGAARAAGGGGVAG